MFSQIMDIILFEFGFWHISVDLWGYHMSVQMPAHGAKNDGIKVHIWSILVSIRIAALPRVGIGSIFLFLCGKTLVERNISGQALPQHFGTTEIDLRPMPPSDPAEGNRG